MERHFVPVFFRQYIHLKTVMIMYACVKNLENKKVVNVTVENLSKSNGRLLTKGDIVYYTRIMPNLGIFDVYDIKIRTIADTWFSGVEKRDKKVFLFPYSAIDEYVFLNRKDAVDMATNAEENNKKVISTETYYEEY